MRRSQGIQNTKLRGYHFNNSYNLSLNHRNVTVSSAN